MPLCRNSSCYRCPTYCAQTFSRNRPTSISYRWIFTCLSLVQSCPSACNNTYLDIDIIFPLDIAHHFSSKPFSSFFFFFFCPNAYQHRTIIARDQCRFLLNQSILILQPCRTLRTDASRAPGLRMDNHGFVVCSSCNRLVCLTYPFTTALGRYAWPIGRLPRWK